MRNRFRFPLAACLVATVAFAQQVQQLQLFLSLTDKEGNSPATLTADDVQIMESGEGASFALKIAKIDPIDWPVKVQILIDNAGIDADSLLHIRTGLRGMLDALPAGVEIGIFTTSPQPRPFVRPTTNRDELLRSVDRFVGEEGGSGKFIESLAEAAQRIERDKSDHFPVIIAVSTSSGGDTRLLPNDIQQMMRRLRQRSVVVHTVMFAPVLRAGGVVGANQTQLALAIKELTGGRFESLAAPSRLATLLPEIGAQVTLSHRRQSRQFRLTVERPVGRSGSPGPISAAIKSGYSAKLTVNGVTP